MNRNVGPTPAFVKVVDSLDELIRDTVQIGMGKYPSDKLETLLAQTESAVRETVGSLPQPCLAALQKAQVASLELNIPVFIHEVQRALLTAELVLMSRAKIARRAKPLCH